MKNYEIIQENDVFKVFDKTDNCVKILLTQRDAETFISFLENGGDASSGRNAIFLSE